MSQKIQTYVCPDAPHALGAYSPAVGYGDLVILAGIAGRDPVTDKVPGVVKDASGKKVAYDIAAETRATLDNMKRILEFSGSSLEDVLEVNTYLLDMKDFPAYNKVYAEYFPTHKPARTTIGVASLPGDIAVEMKMVAVRSSRAQL